jgi:histone H3/H4
MAEQSNTDKKPKNSKKKATNSFKTYIHKVLKKVSADSQIANKTSDQLDEFIKIFARKIAESAIKSCIDSKKSTVGQSEVILAVNLHLPKNLAVKANSEIEKALLKFNSNEKEEQDGGKRCAPIRRETQAGLIFSVSLCEKFLRTFGTSGLNVSKSSSIALTAVLEYITSEILDLASNVAKDNKKVIIIVRHIYLVIFNDLELTQLANELKVEFLEGGVVPNIRPEFLPSKEKRQEQAARRRKNAKKSDNTEEVASDDNKKHHKFLPGTKSLMEIRKYQKTTDLLLRKLPFSRAVRKIAEDLNAENETLSLKDIYFGADSFEVLQYIIESKVTMLCADAVKAAIHGKRDGVNSDDIKMVWDLKESHTIPYSETQISEIGDNGLERLASRGGVKRKGTGMYSTLRCYMFSLLNVIVFRALQFISYRKVITLGVQDIQKSFASIGINVTISSTLGKHKQSKKGHTNEIVEELETQV